MENRKDIGKAFREKLDGLQKSPGDHVWQSIRQDLPKKKRRVLLPFWFRVVAIPVAALLIIAFFTYPLWQEHVPHVYFEMPRETNNEIITTKTITPEGVASEKEATPSLSKGNVNGTVKHIEGEGITSSPNSENATKTAGITSGTASANQSVKSTIESGINYTGRSNKGRSLAAAGTAGNLQSGGKANRHTAAKTTGNVNNRDYKNSKLNIPPAEVTALTPAKGTIATGSTSGSSLASGKPVTEGISGANDGVATADTVTTAATGKDTLKMVPRAAEKPAKASREKAESDKKKKALQDPGFKNMYIYAFAAPTAYNPENAGYLDNSLSAKDVSVEKSFSYGTYLGYNINPKWSIRLGIISTKLELNTDGAPLNNTYVAHEPDEENPNEWIETINPSNYSGISYADGVSNNIIRTALSEGIDEMDQHYANVSLYQKLEYLEVPVEATYSLYGDKFRIGITGGFSTRYLTDSRIYARNNNGSTFVGSYKDEDNINFGASLAAGLYYRFIPSLQLNAEPVLRYYFNSPDNIKPITFGIQAGLQYNFNLSKKKKK